MFNIFINDFIYIFKQSEVCTFADDNIIFCGNSFEVVAPSLEKGMGMSKSMYWFKTNQMAVNAPKFQVLLFGLNSNENIVLKVGGCSVQFNQHVLQICLKANSKMRSAFSRISRIYL